MNNAAYDDPDEIDPGSGANACQRMLDIIDRVLGAQPVRRSLSPKAQSTFLKENTAYFETQYNSPSKDGKTPWMRDCKVLIRAAKLHGRLCSMIADHAELEGAKYPEIPLNIFEAAGRVVTFACPKVFAEDEVKDRSGAWCNWP
jgi:hypothetical protein